MNFFLLTKKVGCFVQVGFTRKHPREGNVLSRVAKVAWNVFVQGAETALDVSGFIQADLRKIQGLFKDI